MVVYSKIFKQAFRITQEHKFLWIFGLFLILGNLLFVWYNETNMQFNYQNYLVILLFVVSILIFILYFRSRAGLIASIHATLEKQDTSLQKAFSASRFFYSRILGIYFMIELMILILGFLIGTPIEYMFSHSYTYRGVGLLVLGLLIFIPVVVIALLINVFAPMFVVIFDLTIREAIERSFELVFRYWFRLLIQGVLLFLVEVPALFLGAIVVIWRGGLVFEIFGIIVFLLLESIITVFQQSAWVLVFQELIKPQKLQEEEPEVVPEIVS